MGKETKKLLNISFKPYQIKAIEDISREFLCKEDKS